MKKILVLILICIFGAALFLGCTEPKEEVVEDTPSDAIGDVVEQSPAKGDLAGCYVALTDSEVFSDDSDSMIIRIYIEFTNNSGSGAAFFDLVDLTATQGGSSLSISEDNSSGITDTVEPGATLKLSVAYRLNDTETEVRVEAKGKDGGDTVLYMDIMINSTH